MLKKEKVNETLGNHPRKKFVILNGNTSGICMIEECTTAAQDVTFKIWGETIFNWGGIVLLILETMYYSKYDIIGISDDDMKCMICSY